MFLSVPWTGSVTNFHTVHRFIPSLQRSESRSAGAHVVRGLKLPRICKQPVCYLFHLATHCYLSVCLSVCPVYRSLHLLLSAYLKITKNCRFPFRLCSSPISDCMRYIVSVIKRVLLRCCSCLHFNILGPYEIRMLRKGIGSRAPVCNVHVLRIDMLVASGTLQVLNIGVLI